MTIQELRDFFEASDYSIETKSKISDVLKDKTEVNQGVFFQIKDILQTELDADFKDLGIDAEGDEEAQRAKKEYEDTLNVIEKDLDDDMKYVEKEMSDLEETRKTISKVADEIAADDIRKSI